MTKPALAQKTDDQARSQAQNSFSEGDAAFDVQDYARALTHFRASYETIQSPNSRLMIARSLLELGRLDEAYDEYGGVVLDAEALEGYEETATTAAHEREALQSRLAWLEIDRGDVPESARIEVGGRERTSESVESGLIAVNPGKTLVKATTADGQEAHAEVHLAAGRRATAKLRLGQTIQVGDPAPSEEAESAARPGEDTEPQPTSSPQALPKRRSLLPYAIAATAVGVVGGAGFVTFGLMSKNHYNALEDQCSEGMCPPDAQKDIDQGKRYQLFANIGLGVGVAGLATGVLLFVLDQKKPKGPVQVDVGWATLGLSGKF